MDTLLSIPTINPETVTNERIVMHVYIAAIMKLMTLKWQQISLLLFNNIPIIIVTIISLLLLLLLTRRSIENEAGTKKFN